MPHALDAPPTAAALRARSYDLLALAQRTAVVDVGCGTGRAVAGARPGGCSPPADGSC